VIFIDGNSHLNAALLGGTDYDEGQTVVDAEGKKHKVNGAQHGVDKFFDQVNNLCIKFNAAPRNMIVVWDGRNAKTRRRAMLPRYKEGRDKIPEVNEQLNMARELVTKGMLDLGAHIGVQDGFEGDDVIGYLCKTLRGERNIVSTGDGDLTVLVDENTDVYRLGKLNENPYGPFPHRHITLYKSLVGDSGDKIPGAFKFGDGAWVDLVRTFGLDSLDDITTMITEGKLHELQDNVEDLKAIQKILDNKDMVTTSWNVASLHIDEINTLRRPLEITAGLVKQWGDSPDQVRELQRFYGTKTLVHAGNYQQVYDRLAKVAFSTSPFVALDIETSSTPESDEWMEARERSTGKSMTKKLDVLGHELAGMSLSFGDNTQHTIYMPVDHRMEAMGGVQNITVDQCREMCELIPQKLQIVIQNRSFEFSVLYRTWGDVWKDNGWHGFVPNAIDSKLGASYVNENLGKGLKDRSKHHLGYAQVTYEETTTKSGKVGTLPSGGQQTKLYPVVVKEAVYQKEHVRVVDQETGEITMDTIKGELVNPEVVEEWESRQYKMNELTAHDVFDYGCDDTICTAALHTHYKLIMDLEHTWGVFMAVEQLPEYLTSLAFVQGLPLNASKLASMAKRDDVAYEKSWTLLRTFLISLGWEGVHCPEFEGTIEPSDVKMVAEIRGLEGFTTKKRKLNGIASDIRTQFPDNAVAERLAVITERDDVNALNTLVKEDFTGEPKINFGSPKQMQNLFYNVLGMQPRLVNKMTDREREKCPEMAKAFKKRYTEKKKKIPAEYTKDELQALISKCSTDDTAVDTALALDTHLTAKSREVLEAYKLIRVIMTRRSLYYVPYRSLPHWRDGRLHPSLNQSEAVTRRYSASEPNVQQQPAHGEGVELRETVEALGKDYVVVSLDFKGQELRLQADQSGDEALTSCFVGDNKRDVHTLTAVSAAVLVFKEQITYDQFVKALKSEDPVIKEAASQKRKDAKTTNFAAAFGAFADTVAVGLKSTPEVAQQFLDARSAAFPRLGEWDGELKAVARERGYEVTMLGARRHLRDDLMSDNRWDVARAERQVANFRIQGSAGEMTKLAMARMWTAGAFTGKYRAVFYFPVHDEIVACVHKDDLEDFLVEVHALMIAPYADMKIPIESDICIGKTFLCEHEIGSTPDLAKIREVLAKIFHKESETA
jgi:DNA polymerase I-like protein with 3'-5' exonuclease and polymerase domains/5'-3' exonuclease